MGNLNAYIAGSIGLASVGGNDSYTMTLLHMDGTDGSTVFTDDAAGGSGHVWTAAGLGPAHVVIDQSVFGGACGLFGGGVNSDPTNYDRISTPYSSDFDFGAGDFTIDGRFRWSWKPTYNWNTIFSWGRSSDADYIMCSYHPSEGGYIYFVVVQGGIETVFYYTLLSDMNPAFAINNWYHYEWSRSGSNMYFFIDGIPQIFPSAGPAYDVGTKNITLATNHIFRIAQMGTYGDAGEAPYHFPGWVDEFRISKGICRHISGFTPPSGPYTNSLICSLTPYESETTNDSWGAISHSTSGQFYVGQAVYTVSVPTSVCKIDFLLSKKLGTIVGKNYHAEIWSVNNVSNDRISVLGSSDIIAGSDSWNNTWVTFSFSPAVDLVSGGYYALVVSEASADAANYAGQHIRTTNGTIPGIWEYWNSAGVYQNQVGSSETCIKIYKMG